MDHQTCMLHSAQLKNIHEYEFEHCYWATETNGERTKAIQAVKRFTSLLVSLLCNFSLLKKPASARGIGIQVIHKWSQMPRKRPLLVQKSVAHRAFLRSHTGYHKVITLILTCRYLHKPYLISGNKFDLRIYVYVTSYDPLRIYIFSDGLVRFASCKSVSTHSHSDKYYRIWRLCNNHQISGFD